MPKQPPMAKAKPRSSGKDPRRLYKWTKLSKDYRKANPICERCLYLDQLSQASFVRLSVHHIMSIESAPHLVFDLSNLLCLCVDCHKHFDALERAGQDMESEEQGRQIKEGK